MTKERLNIDIAAVLRLTLDSRVGALLRALEVTECETSAEGQCATNDRCEGDSRTE
ncbi:hypothetical protein D3C72_2076530 [compost metagenome]